MFGADGVGGLSIRIIYRTKSSNFTHNEDIGFAHPNMTIVEKISVILTPKVAIMLNEVVGSGAYASLIKPKYRQGRELFEKPNVILANIVSNAAVGCVVIGRAWTTIMSQAPLLGTTKVARPSASLRIFCTAPSFI